MLSALAVPRPVRSLTGFEPVVLLLLLPTLGMLGLLPACSSPPAPPTPGARWAAAASRSDVPVTLGAPAPGPKAPDQITRPPKLTSIELPERDINGKPLRVACVTCHSLRASAPLPTSPAELRAFHKGLVFEHGSLACASCHVPGKADKVHLAQGTEIPMVEAMQLCQQCHGPQARDYRHGAHGGMTGRWDQKGPGRVRNNCVECHDPHAPHYVGGQPVLLPVDRGSSTSAEATHE